MSNYAQIENNKVVNVIVIDDSHPDIQSFLDSLGGTWIQSDKANVGATYDPIAQTFTLPEIKPAWTPPPLPATAPEGWPAPWPPTWSDPNADKAKVAPDGWPADQTWPPVPPTIPTTPTTGTN